MRWPIIEVNSFPESAVQNLKQCLTFAQRSKITSQVDQVLFWIGDPIRHGLGIGTFIVG
jgi:hypothetical protein